MGTKKVKFNKSGIGNIPKDKPIVYKIITEGGRINYTGSAKKDGPREDWKSIWALFLELLFKLNR
jgi:hypothetical protein